MSELNFDATSVSPVSQFEPLPAGWHTVTVDEATVKPSKAGHRMLALKLRAEGNRVVFCNLNIGHPNQQVVDIAQRMLSALCHATGQLKIANTDQLVGRTAQALLRIRRDEQGDTNDVRDFRPVAEAPAKPQPQMKPAVRPGWAK